MRADIRDIIAHFGEHGFDTLFEMESSMIAADVEF